MKWVELDTKRYLARHLKVQVWKLCGIISGHYISDIYMTKIHDLRMLQNLIAIDKYTHM